MPEGQDKMTIWVPRAMRAALLRRALELTLTTGKQVSASSLMREALERAGYGEQEK